ncbi:cytochrome c [Zoogloeaceae bacterium G21618-S1]|uniref:Cytochrome c n=1 Tax=Denitromonas halophila TaxID=1629404 RepID=A0A557QWJ2_9RHOO|nr:cytochrome c [Denitromonas halophila]MCZ4306679.1 cytochrome c [Zoogloeaceae bacterium G21618-S1]TVO57283.1 cytochrome c [Denitromonas halophila]
MKTLLLAATLSLVSTTALAEAGSGKQLYSIYCTQCHGVAGDGKGINAAQMAVQPRDHTDTKEMSARTDEELFKVIEHGGKSINKSVLMPPWGDNLNDDEIHALVGHLRELCCQKN